MNTENCIRLYCILGKILSNGHGRQKCNQACIDCPTVTESTYCLFILFQDLLALNISFMLEEILHKYKTDNFLRPFNNVRVAQNIADHFQSDENIYYDGTGNNYNFNIGSKSIRTQPFSDKIAGLGPQQIVNAGLRVSTIMYKATKILTFASYFCKMRVQITY